MYLSHRRHRETVKAENESYESLEGDLHLFEGERGLDVKFKLRVLADLLKCPLCKGYFREAYTIRECLHTFCKVCIYQHCAAGKTGCPTCKEQLPTNLEGIEFDRIIQNMVDKLFPHFSVLEQIEKQNLYGFCGLDYQATPAEERTLAKVLAESAEATSAAALTAASLGEAEVESDDTTSSWLNMREFFRNVLNRDFKLSTQLNMALALFPDNKQVRALQRPYIRTSAQMQVQHIMQYIAGKLKLPNSSHLELFLEKQIIHKSHSLEFVCKSRRFDPYKCILITYRLKQ
ncbi:zinc finger, C3HC4 type (RING finger) domain-containing protein [Cardiosporidium cionae]|uniref:Zinc finger, C3HC4 type (RING finger) domain-containing protein n=1 Tax=Cardiosporidium cionae TaxID=476202 RepID=A0ABQ7JEM0_9APIC|nr:zinc finger, C3HC4 type (RING finger) domain-containing protein [Cardiosporidium cionae]|eukprot:KAF8822451.1 zinc finger, C3HC4 type (RING finger) domain-containing protein [Cardiosporidium cionae]